MTSSWIFVFIVVLWIHLVQCLTVPLGLNMPSESPPPVQLDSLPRPNGFTLIEALVVMALLGILLAIAAPTMTELRGRHQLQAQAQGLLDSMVMARAEALRRQQRVTLCAQAVMTDQCDAQGRWQQGWLVFVDSNSNGLREPQELLLEARAAVPSTMRVVVTNTVKTYFSYNAEGRSASVHGAFMAGTWRFCLPAAAQGWQVVVNALGRPRAEQQAMTSCS